MPLRELCAAAAAAALITGCSTTPPVNHYVQPSQGQTAFVRVGGEGQIAVKEVTQDDADFCYSWEPERNQVLYYLEGVTKSAPASLPYQGRSLGMPASSATRRYPDKNRWAEIKVPADREIEIQYSLPYERIPGSAPKVKLGPDDEMPKDLGGICRTGFRFTPKAGASYEFAFSWGGIKGDRTCGAVITELPGESIVRVRRLQECHRINYDNLLQFNLNGY